MKDNQKVSWYHFLNSQEMYLPSNAENMDSPFDENYVRDVLSMLDIPGQIEYYRNLDTTEYFTDFIYYKEFPSDEDRICLLNDCWFDNVGAFCCNHYINCCQEPHLYAQKPDECDLTTEQFYKNIEEIHKNYNENPRSWIHTDLRSILHFGEEKPIVTGEVGNSYLVVWYDWDGKLSSVARCSKAFFRNRDDFDHKVCQHIQDCIDNSIIERLPDPNGMINF